MLLVMPPLEIDRFREDLPSYIIKGYLKVSAAFLCVHIYTCILYKTVYAVYICACMHTHTEGHTYIYIAMMSPCLNL